jgi:hypothetical protein
MKVKVTVEIHLSKQIEVEAEDMGEAMDLAEEYYHSGDFCFDTQLEPTAKLMMAETEVESTEWVEF